MTDRFKFRAWDIEEQKYREVIALGQDRSFLLNIGHVRNDTQIFEQCTGLRDKNGKMIYEGDIVKLTSNHECVCPVVWDNKETGFCVKYNNVLFRFNTYRKYHMIEVIGNIHENPELLEKSDE